MQKRWVYKGIVNNIDQHKICYTWMKIDNLKDDFFLYVT